jgi:hypothetical protein
VTGRRKSTKTKECNNFKNYCRKKKKDGVGRGRVGGQKNNFKNYCRKKKKEGVGRGRGGGDKNFK